MNITILGAGSFGTAMAVHLASLGNEALMWTIDESQAKAITETRRNNFCFRETELPRSVNCTTDLDAALNFSDFSPIRRRFFPMEARAFVTKRLR